MNCEEGAIGKCYRHHTAPPRRPLALTKYANGNMVPGDVQHNHPAQHRYPVWWTGDNVNLQASIESMVDSGVYDFKPFVHSDCGGDGHGGATAGKPTSGSLIRWTAHCAFGSIFRYHGAEHEPFNYPQATENTVRHYLKMRYKMMPSLIAAGHKATETAFPYVTRCDLYWPEYKTESSSNHQYIFLEDVLVAPIYDTNKNVTSRSVWIPPGTWIDAWSGNLDVGPKTIQTTQ